jgi:soluble lytic murein transglycosylase
VVRVIARALERRAVPEALRGHAAFVAGWCAHRLGEHALAAPLLAEALERYPQMKDQARFLLGDTLLHAGEAARALGLLERVPVTSPQFDEARLVWARALVRVAAPKDVAESLLRFVANHPLDPEGMPPLPPVAPPPTRQSQTARPPPPAAAPGGPALARRAEVSLLLARALEQSRQLPHAVSHYLYVWARFPRTPHAGRARERLADLRRRVGRAAVPDAYYRLLRGRALLAACRARDARGVLAPLSRDLRRHGPAELREPVELALGIALARAGEARRAIGLFRGIADHATDPEVRAEAIYRIAEVLARRRRVEGAVRHYRQVGERFSGSRFASSALLDGAELARLYRRHADARALYERVLSDHPDSLQAPRAHWRLGWYAYRASDFEAADHFRAVVESGAGDDERMRALYWLGRAEVQAGRPAQGAAAYRVLMDRYPLTYYAYLARQRVGGLAANESQAEVDRLAASVGRPPGHAPEEFTEPVLLDAREVLRLGLAQEAHAALKRYQRGPAVTPGGMMVVATLYQELGAERRAHWTLRLRASAYRRHPRQREMLSHWKVAYPRRFVREVEAAAQRSRVPAAMLFALIREESTFAPRAVSTQRAMGLTQVIWETAVDMARELGIRLRSRADLFKPRLNALLGARFLAKLIRTYRQRPILAAAAYNAGPGNVDRWLDERGLRRDGPVPDDEVVEEIPFEETRRYVRRVFGSYAAYSYLYYGRRVASLDRVPAAAHAPLP